MNINKNTNAVEALSKLMRLCLKIINLIVHKFTNRNMTNQIAQYKEK